MTETIDAQAASVHGLVAPASKPGSKMEQLIQSVRRSPLGRQLVPMEAGAGWPIPIRHQEAGKGAMVYVTLPFVGQLPRPAERLTALYPPLATVTVRWDNGRPVEYVDLRYRHPWPEGRWDAEAGTFPHPAVAQLTRDDYQARRRELLGMYDTMLDRLGDGAPIGDEWSARFGELLRDLMEPPLEPFYRALAPKFFARFLGDGEPTA